MALHYIENSKEIKSLKELPKINECYKGINNIYSDYKVISIQAYENEDHPQYLFYNVYYQDTTINNEFYLSQNCCYWSYAIRKDNI